MIYYYNESEAPNGTCDIYQLGFAWSSWEWYADIYQWQYSAFVGWYFGYVASYPLGPDHVNPETDRVPQVRRELPHPQPDFSNLFSVISIDPWKGSSPQQVKCTRWWDGQFYFKTSYLPIIVFTGYSPWYLNASSGEGLSASSVTEGGENPYP
jgi:hypothetical protein